MKTLLCIAVHLYYGPISPMTEMVEAVEECSYVSPEALRRVVSRCVAEGPMRCEVLVTRKRMVVEHKIEMGGGL